MVSYDGVIASVSRETPMDLIYTDFSNALGVVPHCITATELKRCRLVWQILYNE